MSKPSKTGERAFLVQCLRELADRSFQERVWLRGEGPEVSSYAELVCQLFDDSGLTDLLQSGAANEVLGVEATKALRKLSDLLDGIPDGLDALSVLHHPAWTDVLSAAARAADLVAAVPDLDDSNRN